jgi:hypothetical protein
MTREELIERLRRAGYPKSIRENIADSILSLLEAETKQMREAIEQTIAAWKYVKDVDKTPKYEYSRSYHGDANVHGVFPPEPGERWAMPREVADDEIKRLRAALEGK